MLWQRAKKRRVPRGCRGGTIGSLWLLEFSRCPQALRKVLAKEGGVELPSGCFVFVSACDQHWLTRCDLKLLGRHVVCSSELEGRVMEAVGRLPAREKVRLKDKSILTFAKLRELPELSESPNSLGCLVSVTKNSFIHMGFHNSVCGNSTVSSSDANSRVGKHKNPRLQILT